MAKGDGEQGIRVYLRIRPVPTSQQSRLLATGAAGPSLSTRNNNNNINNAPRPCQYEVEEDFNKSVLHLHTTQRILQDAQRSAGVASPTDGATATQDDVVNNTVVDFRYRFDRVFKPEASQEDVFNTVAKDCVRSVLDGLNSTVFAYGQTGSGKTYSITGGTESYQDRGLIPRAMAMIYEEVARRREGAASGEDAATTFTITMSYLQIYNDKGQDLLNHGHDARTLEELPPVSIHEMEEDIVLKGLEQHSAPTLSDALNLLFLGDTNRLYCETPMNKTSSRSHCIFTVYIEARSSASSTVRRSKLNLVDLAGSERVSKTGVSGTILTEAKHINLSLHFLEQVIVALSEKAKGVRDHIPYRNSFLTMVLRDSLGRNCKTAMLATAHVVASQVAETMSTCQFAQRVAMIQQAPQVNVETDPVLLVRKLKAEVAQLKDEVAYLRANGGGGGDTTAAAAADRVLTDDEKNVCRGMVDAYVQRAAVDGDWDSRLTGFNGDMARMYYCYDVLRERLVKHGASNGGGRGGVKPEVAVKAEAAAEEQRALLQESEAQVATLRESLQLKENELQMLLTVLKRAGGGSGGGGAGSGMRYNAPAQTPLPVNTNPSDAGAAANAPPPFFTQFADPNAQDGASAQQQLLQLRQQVFQEAQTLIRQLRQSHSFARSTTAVPSSPSTTTPVTCAANAAAAQAALTRVTTLAQQGQLSEAEAAAATEFLESKKGLQQQQQQRQAGEMGNSEDGGKQSRASDGSSSPGDSRSAVDVLLDEHLVQDRAQALEAFKASYEAQHKVEETKQLLKPKYDACKATAQQLNACVDTMKQLKTKIQRRRAERAADGSDVVDAEETAWLDELRATKESYNTCAAQLRQDKEEIDGMHAYLKHAQEQLVRDFERWFSARQQQVQLAVQQQQRQRQQQEKQSRSAAQQAGLASELRNVLGVAPAATSALEAMTPLATVTRTSSTAEAIATAAGAAAEPSSAFSSEAVDEVRMSSSDGVGYQALSAPVQASSLSRAYPSSAPVQSSAVSSIHSSTSPPTTTYNTNSANKASGAATFAHATMMLHEQNNGTAVGATSASYDAIHFPASARASNRLASLPTHMPAEQLTPASARSLETAKPGEPTAPPTTTHASAVGAPYAGTSHGMSAALGGGKVMNAWVGNTSAPLAGGSSSTTAGSTSSGGRGGALSSSPTRPFHLQPIPDGGMNGHSSTAGPPSMVTPPPTIAGIAHVPTSSNNNNNNTSSGGGGITAGGAAGASSNPYFPQFPSTGNAAADQQLAQLYKAREAMRKQLQ